ncbi:MAG TPA: hypothetical protein VNS02_02540 [Rhizobiaceae bacterium]|nr:hypothetical protein [Rhizobiaceae bacterium]
MDTLISLVIGNGLIAGIVAALVGAVALYVKGRSDGAAKAENKSLKDKLASKEEQLEMHREANAAEREAAGMSDDDARQEALKWARR